MWVINNNIFRKLRCNTEGEGEREMPRIPFSWSKMSMSIYKIMGYLWLLLFMHSDEHISVASQEIVFEVLKRIGSQQYPKSFVAAHNWPKSYRHLASADPIVINYNIIGRTISANEVQYYLVMVTDYALFTYIVKNWCSDISCLVLIMISGHLFNCARMRISSTKCSVCI